VNQVRVLIASYLEPPLVEGIRSVDPRLTVIYRADLLGRPRYPGDHTAPLEQTPSQAAEWDGLVAGAEVMFDTFRPRSDRLPERAPCLRWIQFSSSGVAAVVQATGLADADVVVTNAAGIHARPLAEFVLLAMLYFAKRMPRTSAPIVGGASPSTPCRARRSASWAWVGSERRWRGWRRPRACASWRPGERRGRRPRPSVEPELPSQNPRRSIRQAIYRRSWPRATTWL